ncbi:MAG: esterase family protein [Lachnospiraceae bacterium]|nr:esterase family protein [Lachnospiraceae bacterium]
MALLQVQFYSDILGASTEMNVIMPEIKRRTEMKDPAKEQELPKVLYLLHGFGDDQSAWVRRTSVERYAAEQNLAVIMPYADQSYYCNEVYGKRYWDFVSDELPSVVHRFFRISDRPEDTCVAGLSMGGYGAMRLALTYPERFAAAGSFSGSVDMVYRVREMDEAGTRDWNKIFGDMELAGSEIDVMHLMKKNAAAPGKPRLYVSCGTADFLYPLHRRFVPALRENGWEVTDYEEKDAVHEWGFWDRQIRSFIDFIYEEGSIGISQ